MRDWARRAVTVAAVCLSVYLSACAELHGSEPLPNSEPAPAPAPVAVQPAAAGSAPANVAYRVEIDAPAALKKLLTTYLDLSRFQAAPETDGITNAELVRLAATAPTQARGLLETEGYFSPQITVAREDPPDETPLIRLSVVPGPRTVVVKWELQAEGELQKRIDAGDKDALALIASLRKRWSLQTGHDFSQPEWSSAKNRTLAALRAEGYPTATWTRTEARVDAKTREVTLSVLADSGPLFLMGELRIEGIKRYTESAVRNMADFGPGTPYTEKRLLDYQERLIKLNLFTSASVEIDAAAQDPKAAPVTVKVQEQTLQQAIAGVGFSDNTRERFTFEHRHLRPFGLPLQAHNKFELGRYLRSWEGELLGDPLTNRYRNLVATSISRLNAADSVTLAWRVRAGRTLDTERIQRLVYLELINATVQDAHGDHTSQALTVNYNWLWRDLDDIILPTRGFTSSIELGAGPAHSHDAKNVPLDSLSTSDNLKNGPFGRLYTRDTLYLPLGGLWYSQARVEFGEIFEHETIGIPDPLLFRAGGDDSVRGYGYRELGPTVAGVLVSGRKLLTASVELAHPFSANRPALWWATFIDGGNAANQWSGYHAALGYGVGIRWRSPVGPLRIDWAYGKDVHHGRLHFSVGIAF